MPFFNIFRIVLFYTGEPRPPALVMVPLGVTLNTSAYVMRGVRLLVMYNPALRERYGPYIKEVAMVKALLISFGAIEGVVWSLSLVFGVRRWTPDASFPPSQRGPLVVVRQHEVPTSSQQIFSALCESV